MRTPTAEPSRPSTPAPKAHTPAPPPQETVPQEPPVPYAYEYMTDEVVANWQDSGKQAVQEAARNGDALVASEVVQELVRAGLDRRIDAAQAGAALKDLIAQSDDGANVESLFLDTISLLDDTDAKNPGLNRLVSATGIDPDTMRQELDVPLLTSLGLVRSTFERMRARKTTNQLYRQANFNLLREETEGYAKLLTDYYNAATESAHSDDAEMAKDAYYRIMALVGAFDLDVGRVLDITIDISASLLVKSFRFFVKFYRRSSWWPQKVVLDDVKFEDQPFGALPSWALPDSGKWATSEQDRAELAELRLTRDLAFWDRVRDVGMDAFYELGARRIIDFDNALPLLETEVQQQHDARGNEINADQRKRINENRKYMRETRTLPPPGNPDAAQLLGFKLRFYASPARDANDVLPENLIYLAALLVKIGFISMRDLYSHLYPLDEDMPAERERLEAEKAEKERKQRPGGGMNALLAAGALADDTIPAVRGLRGDAARSGGSSPKPDKKDEEAQEQLPLPTNQKILLLKALLAIGALPDALFILGKFPWLADVDSTIPSYLLRIVRKMLSKLTNDTRPMQDRTDVQDTKRQLSNTTASSDGSLSLASRSKTRTRRWLGLDEPDDGEGVEHLHYYQDWDDNIPICQTVEDVFLLCSTFLGYVGVKIGQDTLVITTLLRLAKRSLVEDTSDSNQTRWLDLMKRLLVPALSLTKHNPAVAQEVWELLKLFPITTRYNIYAEWFTGKTSRTPDMKVALDRNKAEAKDVLRRITNESGKKQARSLAKVSFASPGVVVMTFINQLESYSNMIPGLVESVRYFSLLSFDVLTWCLINALSGQGRNRMQADGMLTSPWLQALSLFVASLFTRYPIINPAPILQYVAYELRNGDSTDLQLIDSVLAEMAGVKSEMNFNETQVLGMTGGELLQSQIVQQLSDQRHMKKTSAKRLMKALSEPGLVGQILISIAQERQMYPHREAAKDMPLKVLGNNLDMIQQIFAQYLDVLRTNLSPSDFEAAVPDVVSLIGDFGLEPGIAFAICRIGILHRMAEIDAARKEQKLGRKDRERSKSQNLGDVTMKEAVAAVEETEKQVENETIASAGDHGVPAVKIEDISNGEVADSQMKDAQDSSQAKEEPAPAPTPQPSAFATTNGDATPWHPVLEPIMERMSTVNPELASRVSIPFYVTFWTLAPQDVIVPMEVYQAEMEKLQAQAKQIAGDRTDMSTSGLKERERKRKAVTDIADKLRAEMNERITGPRGYSQVKMWLNTQKKHWFSLLTEKSEKVARHVSLLQDCFLPRAMMSALDAHYCLQIIKVMHNNATPGFSTLHLLNELFHKQRLSGVISQCTAREAENFGRFLYEILKFLAHWHSKQEIYDKEALGSQGQLHGFAKSVDATTGAPKELLNYEDFRRQMSNWHNALTSALKWCFNSGDYMQIRNSIVVLRTVVPVFPALLHQGKTLSEIVKALSETEVRMDLKLAALSLRGPLKNRENSWVKPQDFRLAPDGVKEGPTGSSRAPSARPETPQPGTATPKLNAGAHEFRPAGPKVSNGQSGKPPGGTEDGEIEDESLHAEKQDVKMDDAPSRSRTEDQSSQSAKLDSSRKSGRNDRRAESKPATPAPARNTRQPPMANGSARGESSRSDSQPPPRPASSAPQRAESGLPPKPIPGAPGGRGNRGGRDDDQYGRLDRPAEPRLSRERSPGHHSRARTPDRDPRDPYGPPRGHRDDRLGPRGSHADARYPREEPRNTTRREPLPPQQMPATLPPREDTRPAPKREPLGPQQMPNNPHGPRDEPPRKREPLGPQQMPAQHNPSDSRHRGMGPPSAQSPHPERLTHLKPESTPLGQQHDSRSASNVDASQRASGASVEPVINPARAALITDAPMGDRDRRRERGARNDERTAPASGTAGGSDNRTNGRHDTARDQVPRSEQDTPTGPRASRASGRELANEPSRASGRLNREAAPSESSFGRLNGPNSAPSPDAPSGPRASNGPAARGGRNFTAPGSTMNTRNEPALPSPAQARMPRDPAGRNDAPPFADRQVPSSQPSTPAPDNGPPPGMHPSRMAKFGPAPLQTNSPNNGARQAVSPTGPPVGPRSNRVPTGTPTGPSPATGPPSGPAGPERKRGGDRQFANLNATLQGAANNANGNGQAPSFRGAARSTSYTAPSPSAPMPPGPPEPVSRRDAPSNPPDLFSARGEDSRDARPRRYEDDRGDLGQRSSRHPSRERRGDDEPSRRGPPQAMDSARDPARGDERRGRDERNGREGGRDRRPGREEEHSRRPLPDVQNSFASGPVPGQPPPPPPPDGPPPAQEWERGPSRRENQAFDNRRGGRGGGGGDFRGARREDDRNGGGRGPSRQDDLMQQPGMDGRKRRHEDAAGSGPASSFDAKRRRSGR
jgi:THO complex subunit 2